MHKVYHPYRYLEKNAGITVLHSYKLSGIFTIDNTPIHPMRKQAGSFMEPVYLTSAHTFSFGANGYFYPKPLV